MLEKFSNAPNVLFRHIQVRFQRGAPAVSFRLRIPAGATSLVLIGIFGNHLQPRCAGWKFITLLSRIAALFWPLKLLGGTLVIVFFPMGTPGSGFAIIFLPREARMTCSGQNA